MDHRLRESSFEYYDERAWEYDDIYLGKGPASISDPNAYTTEVELLSQLIKEFSRGDLVDVACGTGFWLPSYAHNCASITLLDQSQNMLSMCRRKVRCLGVEDKCTFVCADIFGSRFEDDESDCALVGFLVGHLSTEREAEFFGTLNGFLRPGARFLILESLWSEERARTRNKEGRQRRALDDEREFDIFKRYFNTSDFELMEERYHLNLSVVHVGRVYIAALSDFA